MTTKNPKAIAIDDLRFVAEPEPGDMLLNAVDANRLRQRYEEMRQVLAMPESEALARIVARGTPIKEAEKWLIPMRRDFEECSPSETRTVAVRRPVWRSGATA